MNKPRRWSRGHKFRGQDQGHKKIQGQGQEQPYRGQTLLRPRAGILKAKAKDQGHNTDIISEKKVFAQNFINFPKISSVLQKKKVFKKFFASSLAFFKMTQNWS